MQYGAAVENSIAYRRFLLFSAMVAVGSDGRCVCCEVASNGIGGGGGAGVCLNGNDVDCNSSSGGGGGGVIFCFFLYVYFWFDFVWLG